MTPAPRLAAQPRFPRPGRQGRQRITAAAIAIAGLLASPLGAADAPPAPVPLLAWQPCPEKSPQRGFECATAKVPIDYAQPTGETFTLALIRHPAQDPGKRIGTLFWNPGGPSDAGTAYLPIAIEGFPAPVRQRFDILSWDPRGMGGGTTPVVQCFDTEQAEQAFVDTWLTGLASIPMSRSELAHAISARTRLNQQCVHRDGRLLAHVSTADNARDLDLLRAAVGEDQISYYGTSYGTFLGATYLNLFPTRVRAAVLDGAVAPRAWAGNDSDAGTLSTFLRIGSDRGAADTVAAFISECGRVGAPACAFAAKSPTATRTKWLTLLHRLARRPVKIEGHRLDARDLLAYLQGSLYVTRPVPDVERFPGYVAVAQFVQQVWTTAHGKAGAPAQAPTPAPAPAPTATTYTTSRGRQAAVVCGESPNPATPRGYATAARLSYRRAGPTAWPFAALCQGWSVTSANRYRGPWTNATQPVLVIGNTFDPATPYASSQRMAAELANGHLLSVDAFGHTELLNPNRCTQDHVAAYLIDGVLPPTGARCAADGSPFAP